MIILTCNFAISNIYLYDRKAFIKKNTVINKIVPDFMDTLYLQVTRTHHEERRIHCPLRTGPVLR